MSTHAAWPDFRGDRRSTVLCLVGGSMLLAGFLYPGAQATVATTLIVVGAGEVAIGVLLPRMSEFEIGPGGFRTKMAVDNVKLPLGLAVDAEALSRFAHLMSGDQEHGREIVEEALARARQHQRRLSPETRGAFTLQTLIELLDTAEERQWLRGTDPAASARRDQLGPADPPAAIVSALGELKFPARAAFLLRVEWPLRLEDIALLVGQSLESTKRDVELARACMRPHVQRATRS